jgi:hypothetical protein
VVPMCDTTSSPWSSLVVLPEWSKPSHLETPMSSRVHEGVREWRACSSDS